jgi:lipopolysaccharide transport system permease protein
VAGNTLTRSTTAPLDEPSQPPLLVIEPPRGWVAFDWREIWGFRELLLFLIWRDVMVRYKQTALGAAWAIVQPFMTMVVFSIFFGHMAGLDRKTGGVPYPVFAYAGLLPWTFLANSLSMGGNSVVNNANLITKVYFPRIIIPFAAVAAGLVDLAVSFVVLVLLMIHYGTPFSWELALVPLFVLGTFLIAAGLGAWMAALTVTYRDFRQVVPFVLQLWMYVTPVIYPSSIVGGKWHWLLRLNPMAPLIEGCRAALLARPLDWPGIALSMGFACAVVVLGAAYFRTVERRFADYI